MPAHCLAIARALVMSGSIEPPAPGYGNPLVSLGSDSPQLIGELCPTPRGSKPTRSYWSRIAGARVAAISPGMSRPASAGPPGFSTSTPRRLPGSAVAIRETSAVMVLPRGCR